MSRTVLNNPTSELEWARSVYEHCERITNQLDPNLTHVGKNETLVQHYDRIQSTASMLMIYIQMDIEGKLSKRRA